MEKSINLCEILKDCPRGTILYSTVLGEVRFSKIESLKRDEYPIKVCAKAKTDTKEYDIGLTDDGRYTMGYDGECTLFPSKDQRDWSKWQCPKPKKPKFDPKTLKPFDRVLVRDKDDREWLALLFSHINTKGKVIVAGCPWKQVVPYNDGTERLLGTSDEAPEHYRYWEDCL